MDSVNTPIETRRFNYPHLVLIAGLVLSLLAVMFRPAGAVATLPSSVDVFPEWGADTPSSVRLDGMPTVTRDYDVVLHGKKKPARVSLTGVRLSEFLEKVGTKTDGVNFVKIRFSPGNDGVVSLVPLYPDDPERPPIILSEGKKPGLGPFKTPSIVPGQPSVDNPIEEDSFVPFRTGKGVAPIQIVPAQPGAFIFQVKVNWKKTSKGEYQLTPVIKGGSKGAARTIQWFELDKNGKVESKGTGETFTTTNATTGSAAHQINVVVTETKYGSIGTQSFTYNSKKKTKGKTSNPYPNPTAPTGSAPGTPSSGTTGFGSGSGSTQSTTPNFSNPTIPSPTTPPSTTTPPPTMVQPTAPTTTATPTVDSAAITNIAQNASGSGGLQTVSGVLLATPTVAAAADSGGGTPLSALPAPVATELNTIFKPVDSADDLWAYLLAILFATSIAGAVREWVNP